MVNQVYGVTQELANDPTATLAAPGLGYGPSVLNFLGETWAGFEGLASNVKGDGWVGNNPFTGEQYTGVAAQNLFLNTAGQGAMAVMTDGGSAVLEAGLAEDGIGSLAGEASPVLNVGEANAPSSIGAQSGSSVDQTLTAGGAGQNIPGESADSSLPGSSTPVGGGATDAAQPSQAANAGGGAGQTPQNTQSVESLFGRTINASDVSHTAGLQNGVLGEDVGLQTLNQETGLTFESLQNNSNNGADGVVIDPSTNTIWVAEVKSSQNGVSAAANATGDPAEKLDQWVRESLGPSKSSAWQSQPAGNPALAQQIRDAIDAGYQVKGVQFQVGVPAPGSTGTPQVKITPWTSN